MPKLSQFSCHLPESLIFSSSNSAQKFKSIRDLIKLIKKRLTQNSQPSQILKQKNYSPPNSNLWNLFKIIFSPILPLKDLINFSIVTVESLINS